MVDGRNGGDCEQPGGAGPAGVPAALAQVDAPMTSQTDHPIDEVTPVSTDTLPRPPESERADPAMLVEDSAAVSKRPESAAADSRPDQAEAARFQTDPREAEPASDGPAPEPDGSEPGGPVPAVIEPGPCNIDDDQGGPTSVEPDVVAATAEALARIERRLDEVARLGERNADHVGSLHAENQRLRMGEVAAAVAPLMRDVIRMHDDILRLEGSCAAEAAIDLGLVRDLVIGMLDRWGVRRFEPMLGDAFDTAEHNGLARIETVDPVDGMVASVRRCGFRADDGRVWRPADVDVFRQINPSAGKPAVQEE